ncbi:cellulose binding domain-containing protein [Catellatospora sp. NPDC049609]|uniref:cellulose binding domain-containing protein n=1 Tax=Catellatospora sp. NPDC049609 TaxID=3155505 RepID=UPI003420027D
MSKHRLREDDETTLLPRTVEELAVQERQEQRPSRRQPLVIAVATAGLLLSGATAWALAKPTPNPPALVLPEVVPSTPGAGFVDGFGVVTPSPTDLAAQPPVEPAASPTAGPTAAASPSPTMLPSLTPSPSRTVVAAPPAEGAAATAVYDVDVWPGGYVVSVQVRNTGSESLTWSVRFQLPQGASVSGDWEAGRSGKDGVWVFTPDRGPLAPGATYVFGFIGQRGQGDFAVTCTVNGAACQAA